jgi:hypothetical protein
MRKPDGQPLVLMPLPMYEALVIAGRRPADAGEHSILDLVELRS